MDTVVFYEDNKEAKKFTTFVAGAILAAGIIWLIWVIDSQIGFFYGIFHFESSTSETIKLSIRATVAFIVSISLFVYISKSKTFKFSFKITDREFIFGFPVNGVSRIGIDEFISYDTIEKKKRRAKVIIYFFNEKKY